MPKAGCIFTFNTLAESLQKSKNYVSLYLVEYTVDALEHENWGCSVA